MSGAAAAVGFWGARTASEDWCEGNYTKTHYVAEFYNTLSSVPLCLLALLGIYYARRYSYPTRISLAYVGVFWIGLGSVAFHGTLLRWGQALDELSMVWTVTVIFYTLLTDSDVARFPYAKETIFVFNCAMTFTYCTLPFYFIFFVAVFAMIIVALIYRSYMIAFRLSSEAGLSQYHVLWLRRIGFLAWGVYLFGFFALWLVERELFCVPNGWIQLHAVYHLTCALSVYTLIVFATLFNFVLRRGLCSDSCQGHVSPPTSSSSSPSSSSPSATVGAPALPTLLSVRVEADVFPFYAVVIKEHA